MLAAINAHGAAVVWFVRSAAGNRGVWAGGQVLLTANEQMSPDVGPRALKIPSMITAAGSLEEGRQPGWLRRLVCGLRISRVMVM